jgi:hypothetical protein
VVSFIELLIFTGCTQSLVQREVWRAVIPNRVLAYHFAPATEGAAYGYEVRLRELKVLQWNVERRISGRPASPKFSCA